MKVVTTRRVFLKTAPLVAASTVMPTNASASDQCDYHIQKLAEAMKALHGGEWRVDINHASKMAIVVKA